jgi:hypothetical protein
MTVAQVLRARITANAAAAVASLRAVNTAQQSYAHLCHGFAPTLPELKAAGDFLSPDLTGAAIVAKSGYQIEILTGLGNLVVPTPAPGCTGTGTTYYSTAVPVMFGLTGTRSFSTNAQGTIYVSTVAAAPPEATFTTTATPID